MDSSVLSFVRDTRIADRPLLPNFHCSPVELVVLFLVVVVAILQRIEVRLLEKMDDPGGGGPPRAFGSRFHGLADQSDTEKDFIRPNKYFKTKQQKRSATRDLNRETEYLKQIRLDPKENGSRYLILSRTDEGLTMRNLSPFFIKKAMDTITPRVQISRMRDGTLLLKTVDRQQADKLKKQALLGDNIGIRIVEHPTLNTTRGTIYCPDLKLLTDEEILEGLKEARVIEIKRIQRRTKSGDLEDTATFILTFNLSQLPTAIDVGFYSCRVRQYVPSPLRCNNCLKFGHKRDQCRGNRICGNCADLYHDNRKCNQMYVCVNCRGDHSALSKDCPVYIDETEIQRIRVTEKVTMREARQQRRAQVPFPFLNMTLSNRSFAAVTQEKTHTNYNTHHPAERQPTSLQRAECNGAVDKQQHQNTTASTGERDELQQQDVRRRKLIEREEENEHSRELHVTRDLSKFGVHAGNEEQHQGNMQHTLDSAVAGDSVHRNNFTTYDASSNDIIYENNNRTKEKNTIREEQMQNNQDLNFVTNALKTSIFLEDENEL